jgi:hypothetical protein
MAIKTVIKKTGIYLRKTQSFSFSSQQDISALSEAVEEMNQRCGLQSILDEAVECARDRLLRCGVEMSSGPTGPEEFWKKSHPVSAGDLWIRIPTRRPVQIRPTNAPLNASRKKLRVWWSTEISRAQRVLWGVLEVRREVEAGNSRDAALHAIKLGRALEMLLVAEYEPLASSGRRQRNSGPRAWKDTREIRDRRKKKIWAAAAKLRSQGRHPKEIAWKIEQDRQLNISDELSEISPLSYGSILKYIQEGKSKRS